MNNTANKTLRILFIGNEHSTDCLHWVSALSAVGKTRVETACLEKQKGTVRHHARNVAQNRAEYTCRTCAPGTSWTREDGVAIGNVLSRGWDAVVLQQDLFTAGMHGTLNEDLAFLLDYLADLCPGIPIYWNMTWAWQQDVTGSLANDLQVCYEGSQIVMYNAIADSIKSKIIGKTARFGNRFAGWFPVGTAIQNLRRTYGDRLTRNGTHLSEHEGRLTAALTILRVLFPEWPLSALAVDGVAGLPGWRRDIAPETLEQIRTAVESACVDLSHAPAALDAPKPVRVEDVGTVDDVTVAQTQAPYKLHFPDSAVMADGTLFVSAYENTYHYPDIVEGDLYGWQGCGRLLVWKSTDNGKTFDTEHPVLVVEEDKLDEWGVVRTRDRYARWKAGEEDYVFNADPRDPNFAVVWVDINGDGVKEEVLLYTFCMVNYHEGHISHSLNMNWSIDGGKTWSTPQEIRSVNSPVLVKRGDMAIFSDGQILVPTYFRNKIVLLLMQWSGDAGKWVNIHDTVLPDPAPEKTGTYEYNELSVFAPNPDGDMVYGFVRANAAVVRSYDRGRTWQLIGMEDGLIHQPGFALVDKDRVFVTWARIIAPRTVYGKVYYFNGDWTDTGTRIIYASPEIKGHDMADPSCRRLADGRIYTVCYDTAYRSIVGTFDDPDSEEFLPVEMDSRAGETVLYENCAPDSVVCVDRSLPGSYTIHVDAVFEENGELNVETVRGGVVRFRSGGQGIRSGQSVHLSVLAIGTSTYWQVLTADTQERDRWMRADSAECAGGRVICSGQNVNMSRVCVSRRIDIQMNTALEGIVGGTERLKPVVRPAASEGHWTTGDACIAAVENGTVTYTGSGTTKIGYTVDGVTAQCLVRVVPMPPELTGDGEKYVLFSDSYQSFPVGKNMFWEHMQANGYRSNGAIPTDASSYDIEEENGTKHLKLTVYNGKRTWHRVAVSVQGDYTLRFDFRFSGGRTSRNAMAPGHCLYINLWQESDVLGILHLTPEGLRCEYEAQRGGLVTDPELFADDVIYTLNHWYTIRVSRVNGGLYAKVWPAGESEPEKWSFVALHRELDTNNTACPRLLYYASGTQPRSVCIRALEVSQKR